MEAVLDMNSNRIINLPEPVDGSDAARLTDVLAVAPGTGINTFLVTPTSANLAAALTDETGTGLAVFNTSPALTTPVITGGSFTGGTDIAVADGGTGASTAAGARTNLGLGIGTDVQAYDADLAAFAANSTNGLWARTGSGTGAARTITGTASQIGVTNGDGVSGNPVLSLLGNALAFAGLTGAADKLAYFTSSAAMAVTNLVSQARSFLADPSAAYVNFLQAGTGAVATTVQTWIRGQDVNAAVDFGCVGDAILTGTTWSGTDNLVPLQAAIDAAYAAKKGCFIPAGNYYTSGTIIIPGTVDGVSTDDRDKHFELYGAGYGEPFVYTVGSGTTLCSNVDAPVIQDILGTAASSNGTFEMHHLRVDGKSTTPVVLMQSFYGLSTIHNMVIFQRSTGDGLKITYGGGFVVREVFAMNSDLYEYTKGAARTGIGFNYEPTSDMGLPAFSKLSARGWLTGYRIGGGAGTVYGGSLRDSEVSTCYSGVRLNTNTRKFVLDSCYFENGDQGIGIDNRGKWATISNNFVFSGFSVCIQDTDANTDGTQIIGNVVSVGAVANSTCIYVAATAHTKKVTGNHIIYTAGTTGCYGLYIPSTSEARIDYSGNSFDPTVAWTGSAGTTKIYSGATETYGLVSKQSGNTEIPALMRGVVSFAEGAAALTQSNVSGNILTTPEGGYFLCSATAACTVLKLETGNGGGKLVIFQTTTANMTFTNGAYMQLAGGASFTGPGVIGFIVNRTGSDDTANELFRSVY